MPKIEFLLKNYRKSSSTQRVLVFLRPEVLAEGISFHAWQTLGPVPRGGSQPFTLEGRLAVMAAEDVPQGSCSARWSIEAGQILVARRSHGQGPALGIDSREIGSGGPARVLNKTDEPLRFTWYCDGKPILRQTVAPGAAAELRLVPGELLFQVREPARDGLLYPPAEVLRHPIDYVVPDETSQVDILWSRSADKETLLFDPPSALPDATSRPEAEPQEEPKARKRKS